MGDAQTKGRGLQAGLCSRSSVCQLLSHCVKVTWFWKSGEFASELKFIEFGFCFIHLALKCDQQNKLCEQAA